MVFFLLIFSNPHLKEYRNSSKHRIRVITFAFQVNDSSSNLDAYNFAPVMIPMTVCQIFCLTLFI